MCICILQPHAVIYPTYTCQSSLIRSLDGSLMPVPYMPKGSLPPSETVADRTNLTRPEDATPMNVLAFVQTHDLEADRERECGGCCWSLARELI